MLVPPPVFPCGVMWSAHSVQAELLPGQRVIHVVVQDAMVFRVKTYLEEIGISDSIQCASLDSPSFGIYCEIKTTEVRFSTVKSYLCKRLFPDSETKLGEYK